MGEEEASEGLRLPDKRVTQKTREEEEAFEGLRVKGKCFWMREGMRDFVWLREAG